MWRKQKAKTRYTVLGGHECFCFCRTTWRFPITGMQLNTVTLLVDHISHSFSDHSRLFENQPLDISIHLIEPQVLTQSPISSPQSPPLAPLRFLLYHPSSAFQTSVKRLIYLLLPPSNRAPSSPYQPCPSSLRDGKSCALPQASSSSLHTLQVRQGQRRISTRSWRTCQRYELGGS